MFRHAYRTGKTLTVCEAILATQDSLSKDLRDRIFALIGICADGRELVPTPSYHLTPQAVMRDPSRELLRKYLCFDIDLLDKGEVSSSTVLPIWSPDWLSPTLPEDAPIVASRSSLLPHSYALRCSRDNVSILRIQGVVLGVVAAATSPIGSDPPAEEARLRRTNSIKSGAKPVLRYYGGSLRRVRSVVFQHLIGDYDLRYRFGATMHLFLKIIGASAESRSNIEDASGRSEELAPIVYGRWLNANHSFSIADRPLGTLLTEQTLSYCVLTLVASR